MAPAIAGVAVGVGVPILLAYIYGVVPVSLCQNGVCGVSTSPLGVRIDFDDDDDNEISDAANETNGGGATSTSGERTSGGSINGGSHSINILSGLGDDQSCGPLEDNANASSAYFSRCSGGGSIEGGKRCTDAVSLDAASNNLVLVGNPSIGIKQTPPILFLILFLLHLHVKCCCCFSYAPIAKVTEAATTNTKRNIAIGSSPFRFVSPLALLDGRA